MKTYPLCSILSFSERKHFGVPETLFRPSTVKGIRTGEYRNPKAGEWFLSGAIPEAYHTLCDLNTKYHILKLVKVEQVVTEKIVMV